MKTPALSVENVTVSYEGLLQPAIEDITFSIPTGSITALVGPNGSGKTTLIKTIIGLLPYKGSIAIDGKPLSKSYKHIGYVPQRFSFDLTYPVTVIEFLSFALWDFNSREREQIIKRTLADVGAESYTNRLLSTLSGGQLQRILLARALSRSPKLILLDEPEAGVDKGGEQTFYELLTALSKHKDLTVIVASHDLDLVYAYADSVICINRSIFCSGAPRDVLGNKSLAELYGREIKLYGHTHEH